MLLYNNSGILEKILKKIKNFQKILEFLKFYITKSKNYFKLNV